ncbi:MAG: hypothetical protein IJM32_06700 [Ruminococcus sp.]|nr:hypothetical protein [Ruminococcus sp.]
MRNYNKYQFSLSQMMLWVLCDSTVMFAMGYLFFKNIVLAAAALIAVPFFIKLQKQRSVTKQKRKLLETFRMFICSLSAAMSGTGTSVELAVKEAYKELADMCPSTDCFVNELENILMTVDNNRAKSIENEFESFAQRTGLVDIIDFASVLTSCRRSNASSIPHIVRLTSGMISDKLDIMHETKVVISENKTEFYMLMAAPSAFLAFMGATMGNFADVLYNTAGGRILMAAILAVNIGCFLYGVNVIDDDNVL